MAFNVLFFFGVTSLCISIPTVIGNALTLYVFYQERSLRKNPSNNLIIALTFNDLLYGIQVFFFLGIPFTLHRTHGYIYGETGCMIAVCLNHVFVIGNLLLLAISIDRVLLISLKYSTYMKFQTNRRVAIAIAMCYAAGIMLGVIEMSMWEFAKKDESVARRLNFDRYCVSPPRNKGEFGILLSFGFYVTPITSVALLNVVFFALLIRKLRKRGQVGDTQSGNAGGGGGDRTTSSANNHGTVSNIGGNAGSTSGSQNGTGPMSKDGGTAVTGKHIRSHYIKAAITLGVLVGAMAISNLPYCTFLVVIAVCPACRDPIMVRYWLLICQLNSLLDPLFYTLTQRKIKEYYKRKFKKIFKW